MDAKVEKIENGEAYLEIEVSPDKFEEGMEKAYRITVKKVNVPGFRKGKVPRQILESYYGPEVLYQDALEFIIPPAFDEAVSDLELDVLGQPEFDFDIETMSQGQPFVFKASVAVKPEVILGELEGLEINIPDLTITEKMVDNRLDSMRESYSQMVEKTDGYTETGDNVTIDFEGSIDEVSFEGGKGEDYPLVLGSNTFIPGFEEQLIGLKTGDEKDVNVSFPEDYQAEELAGKAAVFKVKVKGVQTKQMRELNDEFVQEVSENETVEELRKEVRKDMEKMSEMQRKKMIKQQVLDKAAALCEIPLADSAITVNAPSMIQVFEQRLASQGLQLQQYMQMTNSTIEDMIEKFKPEAERDLKNTYMLEKIVIEKGIELSNEEIDEYMKDSAEETGLEEEQIRKNLEGIMDVVEMNLKKDKAVDYLIDNAIITVGEVTNTEESEESESNLKE